MIFRIRIKEMRNLARSNSGAVTMLERMQDA